MPHRYGYCLVSAAVPDPAEQTTALRAAGCRRIFTDHATGRSDPRPQLDALVATVNAGAVVVVWRLDRIGQSLPHLLGLLDTLAERGVGFRSLTEGLDSNPSDNRQGLYAVTGALAAFQQHLRVDRAQAGLAAARARGRRGGRRPTMTKEMVQRARQMYDSREHTVEEIANQLGVSRMTIYRHLARAAAAPPAP